MRKTILWTIKNALSYGCMVLVLQTITVNIFFASALVRAQNLEEVRLNITSQRVTLEEALRIIEQSTGFKFAFDANEIPLNSKISLQASDAPLSEVLESIAGDLHLVFNRIDNQIVVKMDPNQQNRTINLNSSLKGVITDATSNESLIGVNVSVLETSLGAATDIEGKYRIVGIPERLMKVKISYVGYEPKVIEVDFSKTRDVNLDVVLKPALIQGEEVVVTAQMRGQNAAINQQLTSNTIINVISEEKIKELPDVNAAEAIGRLPGVSMTRSGGEANKVVLRGLSPKFSNITIDGVRIAATDDNDRSVDLSSISQSALSGIELFKAITADKDADAIAGTVNLVTRKAPSEMKLRFDLLGNYNLLMKSANQYNLSGQYGQRFFNDFLGIQATGNFEKRIRSDETRNFGYYQQNNNTGIPYINNTTLTFVDEIRKREGANIILDFNTPDSGYVKLSGGYNKTNRSYTTNDRNYPVVPLNGSNAVSYDFEDIETDVDLKNISALGKNYFLGLDVDWGLSLAQSVGETPYDYILRFIEPSDYSAHSGMDNTAIGTDAPTHYETTNAENYEKYAFNNYSATIAQNADDKYEKNFDKERTASIDITKKYSVGNLFGSFLSGELKLGAKYRQKDRWKNNSDRVAFYGLGALTKTVLNPDGTYSSKDYSGTRFATLIPGFSNITANYFIDSPVPSRVLFGKNTLKPLFSRSGMRLWRDLNINGANGSKLEYGSNFSVEGDNYFVTERTSAGYVMNTFNFGQSVTLIAGVRVEQENNDYKSRYTPYDVTNSVALNYNPFIDTTGTHTETSVLPNFHLSLNPTEWLKIRFAAYKALARPDFDLRLIRMVSQSNDKTVNIGNVNLKDAQAWNYEANTSVFDNTLGLISVSAFYKEIKNLIQTSTVATDGDTLYRLYNIVGRPTNNILTGAHTLTFPYNSRHLAKAWGFEFEHQINLRFLPGYLQYFSLTYNLSYTLSEAWYLKTALLPGDTTYSITITPRHDTLRTYSVKYPRIYPEEKQRIAGQQELYGNASLGYDIGGLSVKLSLVYNGKYTNSYASTSEGANTVVDPYYRWDFSGKYKITDNIALMVNIINLTNVPNTQSSVRDDPNYGYDRLKQSDTYGLTADFGVIVTL